MSGFASLVGHTKLVRLARLSELTGCDIVAKAEFLNPGGSIKDRAAVAMLEKFDAEREKGNEKKDAEHRVQVVEGTAGNTGVALAHVCRQRRWDLTVFVPPKTAKAKVERLERLGASVVVCASASAGEPAHFFSRAKVFAEEARKARGASRVLLCDQFSNVANRDAHFRGTGPELWEQTGDLEPAQGSGRRLDYFVCATGTGGTLAGVSRFLKEQDPAVHCVLLDSPGQLAAMVPPAGGNGGEHAAAARSKDELVSLFGTEDGTLLEGVSSGRLYDHFSAMRIDSVLRFKDNEAIAMVHHLYQHEGLFLGGTSGANVLGAFLLACKVGPGHRIATVLPDGGAAYEAKLYSDEWLEESGFSVRCNQDDYEPFFDTALDLNGIARSAARREDEDKKT
jgi:cysteine synthase